VQSGEAESPLRYVIHGLQVESTWNLPLQPCAVAPGAPPDVQFTVDFTRAPTDEVRYSRTNDADRPWVIERWTADGSLVVEFLGSGAFLLDTSSVTLVSAQTDDRDWIVHLLLDHVLPRVVALRGDLMLHAAGLVGPSGHAHLLVGTAGTGKSTLASALAVAAWPLLDDDGIRVVRSDGVWLALPGYSGVRLLPDAVEALGLADAPSRSIGEGHPKRRFALSDFGATLAAQPVPICAIHVLRRAEGPPHSELLGFAESVAAVAGHAVHLADRPESITQQGFERSTAILDQTAVLKTTMPAGLRSLPDTIAHLRTIDEELALYFSSRR
jgi:hypothetical protein